MTDNSASTVLYVIDKTDTIISVNAAWNDFALANDGAELVAENVIGMSLWEYISDGRTRDIYEVIFKRARESNTTIRVPFRCDSPSLRRYLALSLRALPEDRLEFQCSTLKLEPRNAVPLLDRSAPRSSKAIRMCGWCKKVDVEQRGWLEVEDAIAILDLFGETELPMISHGICNECSERHFPEEQ